MTGSNLDIRFEFFLVSIVSGEKLSEISGEKLFLSEIDGYFKGTLLFDVSVKFSFT